MRHVKSFLIVFGFVSVFVCAGELMAENVISPDKEYSISTEDLSNEIKLIVSNNQTQVIENSFSVPIIPSVIKWAPDSKAVATIFHISGGSVGGIIRQVNHQWVYSLLEPPIDEPSSFSVIETQFKNGSLSCKYRVITEKNNGEKYASYLCTFDVNLKTGVMTNIQKIGVTH